MPRENLTHYNDDELSMRVMNDEGLYRIRRSPDLWDILDTVFIYTEKQKDILAVDLEDEKD